MIRCYRIVACIAAVLIALALIGAAVGLSLDLSAQAEPSGLEQRIAPEILALNIRLRQSQREPFPQLTPQLLQLQADVYAQQCSLCHGASDGTPGAFATSFSPRPPQFATQQLRHTTSINAYIIRHGIRWTAMPAFASLPEADAGRLAQYLDTMRRPTSQ
jgi:mono/diheme cytochrome c family protein